jgi:hypothetical protein
MATIGLQRQPWVVGDAIAHKDFSIHWEDSVTAGGDAHTGHADRIVITDDADRVVLEGWVSAAPMPDGGAVELEYKITHPGLREGLHTATVEVDTDGKDPSAKGECAVPVTFAGEGVAKQGEEYHLSFDTPTIIEKDEYSSASPVAGVPFRVAVGVHNNGPDTAPSARQCSVRIAGSGGQFEDDRDLDFEIEVGSSGLLTFLVDHGLPAGVYRAEIWCDLVTTMSPISTTFDFTVADAAV